MAKRCIAVLGLLLALTAIPAAAQSYRVDLGVNGGFSVWTPFLTGDLAGSEDVKFSSGWLVGGQATFWVHPRVGVRANLAYEDREIEADGVTFAASSGADHVNLWGASGDLLIRLKTPSETFVKGEFLPYLALGGGVRYINPAGDEYIVLDTENDKFWSAAPFTPAGQSATYSLGELSSGMGLIALGADWRMANLFALRFEVGDRIQKPHVYQVEFVGGSPAYRAIQGEENRADLNHDIYGTIGLHLTLFGADAAPVVAVAPPPPPQREPPPPPPAREPPPPPPPAEEAVTVCVIDPAAAGGVRNQAALYLPASRDTVVVQGAQRVALGQYASSVPVMASAEWYVAGQPFMVGAANAQAPFLTVGRPVTGQGRDLVLLGQANGVAVFAPRSELGTGASAFSGATASSDLNALLASNAAARTAFANVQNLYLPYGAVGCSFQGVQRQPEVIKK